MERGQSEGPLVWEMPRAILLRRLEEWGTIERSDEVCIFARTPLFEKGSWGVTVLIQVRFSLFFALSD